MGIGWGGKGRQVKGRGFWIVFLLFLDGTVCY